MTNTEEKEWYNAREASDYLGIPMHRLARLRREGRISSIGGNRDPLYHVSVLQEAKKNPETIRDLRVKKGNDSAELADGRQEWYLGFSASSSRAVAV